MSTDIQIYLCFLLSGEEDRLIHLFYLVTDLSSASLGLVKVEVVCDAVESVEFCEKNFERLVKLA